MIFAWFEDKAAVFAWYRSEMHTTVQDRFFADRPAHVPLEHIADDSGPIMAIASLTWADSPAFDTPLPVSQIAIELYAPLSGGVFLGGRFAPGSLHVDHMLNYTPTER